MGTKVEILQYCLVSVTATCSVLLVVRAAVPVFLQKDAKVRNRRNSNMNNTGN
jgi:hypothetical protein